LLCLVRAAFPFASKTEGGEATTHHEINDIVWSEIDNAFSEPVTRADDTAEYAATQIIAEVFREEGYDGVAYKSAFGDDGYSVALFNLEDANQVNAALFETTAIEFKFNRYDDPESG
jgi:hypothetical protein